MNQTRLKGFVLFEVLVAWALFFMAITGLFYAKGQVFHALQRLYFINEATVQLQNIKAVFLRTVPQTARLAYVKQWQLQNTLLFGRQGVLYNCHHQRCCFRLTAYGGTLSTCS